MAKPPDDIPQLTLTPIGVIHTAHKERFDAPRQAESASVASEGRIVLYNGSNFEDALQDLDGFECIWILFWFNRNTTWKPKVLPPRGGKQRRGVFATRSPYRPNPIGLSRATLLGVRGRTLRVKDTDLLDGTPILDIKPYLPYADAAPHARVGWLENVGTDALEKYAVEWSSTAAEQDVFLNRGFDTYLRPLIERVLEHDPAPHAYRRITARPGGGLTLALKSWRIDFAVRDKTVIIERIRSGYTMSRLKSPRPGEVLDQAEAHMAFLKRDLGDASGGPR